VVVVTIFLLCFWEGTVTSSFYFFDVSPEWNPPLFLPLNSFHASPLFCSPPPPPSSPTSFPHRMMVSGRAWLLFSSDSSNQLSPPTLVFLPHELQRLPEHVFFLEQPSLPRQGFLSGSYYIFNSSSPVPLWPWQMPLESAFPPSSGTFSPSEFFSQAFQFRIMIVPPLSRFLFFSFCHSSSFFLHPQARVKFMIFFASLARSSQLHPFSSSAWLVTRSVRRGGFSL